MSSNKEPERVLGDGAKGDLDNPDRGVPEADPAAVVNTNQDETVDTAADAAGKDDTSKGESKSDKE